MTQSLYSLASPDALAMMTAWKAAIHYSATFLGFIAPSVIRLFPWIIALPLKVIRNQQIPKHIVRRLAAQMLECGGDPDGKDILSCLLRSADKSDNEPRLNKKQVIDNVCSIMRFKTIV